MTDQEFQQKLLLVVVDKLAITLIVAIVVILLNRWLERYRADRSKELQSIKSTQDLQLQIIKNQLDRENQLDTNIRLSLAEVVRQIASGVHSICWLCWAAKFSPHEVTKARLDAYDAEIHKTFADLVGARAILASLSPETHARLEPIINELYATDVKLATAKAHFGHDNNQMMEGLSQLYQPSVKIDDKLIQLVKTPIPNHHQ